MLNEDLLRLIEQVRRRKAESRTVEVKAAHEGCPRRLYDTLSSFSNQDGGGVIIFGLDESRHFAPVGVYDLHDLQKQVTEQCNQMEPPVRAVFTAVEIEGLPVCAAEVPGVELAQRPCYYRGAGRVKGSFLRVGDADLPMTDYELYSFETYRGHLHDDKRVVERAAADMMDQDAINTYLLHTRVARPGFARVSDAQALELLNITRGGAYTLAAVMNFALFPQGYFPQLGITAVVVPGTQIGDIDASQARFTDNKRIEGTLAQMAEQAMGFCVRNMKTKTIIDRDTGQRRDEPEYPHAAVREAILNALIHRDYSFHTEGTPIQIDFFTDRLEIHSPGTLYGRMTVEKLGMSRPEPRNPALAVIAETLLHTENRYSGIPTMRREMAARGLPAPVFENRRDEFVVTFYNGTRVPDESRRYLRASSPDAFRKTHHEQPFEIATQPKPARTVPHEGATAPLDAADLLTFCKTPRTRSEIADFLGLKTQSYAMSRYIKPLYDAGRLAATLPLSSRSKKQKFYTIHS